ncbi:S-adenosyl-L-methionine-dependent methyltransferase [Xylariaceae sp. FL1651]|nr:S-adenosyl-L-methionine-dependent methyltransferase [Xylariaceae sp. FL1651]
MSNPLEEMRSLLAKASEASRKDILIQLHELIVSVETAEETATRIALYPLQTSVTKIGQDLKIFEILANSGPRSLEELQALTKAHPITLRRLLRYMASVGLVRETGTNQFETNKKCQNLATPGAAAILTHFFENCGPLFQEMPRFLHKNDYQDVTDGNATVFQTAYKTDKNTYEWFSQHPEHKAALVRFMAMEQAVRGSWLDEYPIKRDTQSWDPEMPVFVDVGGNVGHYCALFKKKYPEVPGRVILQDLPSTIAHALQTPGVETIGHNFFEYQQTKGSKYYHLGWILHNWNDEKSRQILHHIKLAMTEESVLLINDMILPDAKVPAFAASLDLVMLGACGSRERTIKEWKDLLDSVGLLIKECIVYNPEQCHGIISAALE